MMLFRELPTLIRRNYPIANAITSGKQGWTVDQSDSIICTVNLDGDPVPGARVLLYWKKTGELIAKKITDGNGQVVFDNQNAHAPAAYFAIAEIPETGEMMVFNAL